VPSQVVDILALAVSVLGLLAGLVWHCLKDARERGRQQVRIEDDALELGRLRERVEALERRLEWAAAR
jgi:hypothetical protein